MTKEEYMKALASQMRRLPKADRDMALEYFEEYFQEAGEEHQQQAMEDLGTPKEAADQILLELAEKCAEEPMENVRQGWNKVWVCVLALFAAPIGIPLVFAGILVAGSLVLTVGILFLSILLSGAGGAVLSAVSVLASIVLMFQTPWDGLVNFGLGLALTGACLLIFCAGLKLCIWFEKILIKMMSGLVRKGGKRNED